MKQPLHVHFIIFHKATPYIEDFVSGFVLFSHLTSSTIVNTREYWLTSFLCADGY